MKHLSWLLKKRKKNKKSRHCKHIILTFQYKMTSILFFSEETDFQPPLSDLLKAWLQEVVQGAGKEVKQLHFIFCSDAYLHGLNQRYLQHDTLTDVITFDYTEDTMKLEGDIYISIDTVRVNAQTLGITFVEELCRVLVHGVLHLIGYDDKEEAARARMRQEENRCLAMPQSVAWREKNKGSI